MKMTQDGVEWARRRPGFPPIVLEPYLDSTQFYRVINASFSADYQPRRLLVTGPRFLLKDVPVLGARGEGPDHGEDHNYEKEGPRSKQGPPKPNDKPEEFVSPEARQENVDRQNYYIRRSLYYYTRELASRKRRKRSAFVEMPWETRYESDYLALMISHLGNACHVAQDRGAHWDGTKGMGHRHPDVKRHSWKPDVPSKNPGGHGYAKRNTTKVFESWIGGIRALSQRLR